MHSTALPQTDSPELRELFADVPEETLERSRSIIYATNAERELIYVNAAWDGFARANGAPHLMRARVGRCSVIECAGPLKSYYAELFDEVVRRQTPSEHEFQCSSPGLFRAFQMRVLPTRSQGVLVVNSLVVERPHDEEARAARLEAYADADGILTMCSHCRRTKQPERAEWDWVPGFVERQPEQVSHGLCPVCLEYHYLRHKRS